MQLHRRGEAGWSLEQVLKASGAKGPGVMGMMHWQAAQIATPLRAWNRENDLGPMGGAAAATAWSSRTTK